MNKNEKLKLDVMDGIDEDIIEKKTEERYMLLQRAKSKPSRKMIITVTSAAASFFVIFGIILSILILFSNIPVYTGMTVSGEPPVAAQQESIAMSKLYPRTGVTAGVMRVTPFTSLTGGLDLLSEETTDVFEETTDIFEETTDVFEEDTDIFEDHTDTSEETTDASEKLEIEYYATIGQDIYITVHIDNPDNYAILQFTFNGKVYNSYMFEEGSDMENLVLKYNVGDQVGCFEYTIDAIKYVDGTEIKDVRMDGDRTVTVAVGVREPEVDRNLYTSSTAFAILCYDIMISDPDEIIKKSNGHAYAVLLHANTDLKHISLESVVAKKEIAIGELSDIKFGGLEHETKYIVAIVAEYDAYDGEGLTWHLLSEANDSDELNGEGSKATAKKAAYKVSTPSFVRLYTYVENGSIFIELDNWNGIDEALISSVKVELLDYSKEVVAEGDANTKLFENMPSGTYYVRVIVIFDNNDGKGQQTKSRTSYELRVEPCGLRFMGELVECATEEEGCFAFTPGADGKVYAPMDGVLKVDESTDGRFKVTIYRKTDFGGNYYITYSYLQSLPEGLKTAVLEQPDGVSVSAGDLIGIGGTTDISEGCVETEPHIHVQYYATGLLRRENWDKVISGEYSPFESGLFVFVNPNEE